MIHRRRIRITGVVQGVGFRPWVWHLANRLQLSGWVCNDSQGVLIEAQGDTGLLDDLAAGLFANPPPLAIVESIRVDDIACDPSLELESDPPRFQILDSDSSLPRSVAISPDIAPCGDCLQELLDPADRRFRYPFINCTNCGPRFTIIEGLPYDRSSTTMRSFAMCPRCTQEYRDPSDRRFHAQPNACPDCGPQLGWVWSSEATPETLSSRACVCASQALVTALMAIRAGKIVAIKGVGGFHLACDAANAKAVATLRQRKQRGDKPLAVMVLDTAMAQRVVVGRDIDWQLLESKERPIVLLPKRSIEEGLDGLAPGNDCLGVMLPISPLHYLLAKDFGGPLVMTSANVSEEPIVIDNVEAGERLRELADGFLLHDRPIAIGCDDSVIRRVGNRWMPIRRSRGYAPIPIRFAQSGPDILAVGAELKGTFCLVRGEHAYVSQHIGDMSNLATLRALERNVGHLETLLDASPTRIACDLHPGYISSQWAERVAAERGIELLRVQHHHAHLAALAAEHRLSPDEPLCAFVLDGTGYGTDGTIWGGEVLMGRGALCERMAWVEPFPLAGGDMSIRYPARVALSLLRAANIPWSMDFPSVRACTDQERRLLEIQFDRRFNCVDTSSMGRLFDGVASLLGVRHSVAYEAQAAMELETLASRSCQTKAWADPEDDAHGGATHGDSLNLCTARLIGRIVRALREGTPTNELAAMFHWEVVAWITHVALRLRETHGIESIGLTGGVFQNALLTNWVTESLVGNQFQVLAHRFVPCNDGGLALGQAWIARCGPAEENSKDH